MAVNTAGTNIYTDQAAGGTGSSLYAGGTPAGYGTSDPLGSLPGASMALRNTTLQGLYSQLKGPSMQNLYESGLVDKAASGLRAGRQTQAQTLQARGLYNSGARNITNRGLQNAYSESVLGAVDTAGGAETARKQNVLDSIAGVNAGDVDFLRAITEGAAGTRQSQIESELTSLALNRHGAIGSASIAAAIAGGAVGAAGAGAGSGLSGAAQGAAKGLYQEQLGAGKLGFGSGDGGLGAMDARYGGGGSGSPYGGNASPSGFNLGSKNIYDSRVSNYEPWLNELLYGGYGGGQ